MVQLEPNDGTKFELQDPAVRFLMASVVRANQQIYPGRIAEMLKIPEDRLHQKFEANTWYPKKPAPKKVCW